jgi:putative flippase GtrA
LIDDVVKCATALLQSDEAIVMGVRDFYNADVPLRNSIGNRTTALVFRLLFGIRLRDTQTGLRGIPAQHIPMLLGIRGNRFEYETNMLLEIERRSIPFREVEIETVYEAGSNNRSHFRPFIDSLIIFSRILKYAASSVMSFLVDIGMFWLALSTLDSVLGLWSIPICTAIARAVSSFFNFNVNRWLVFQRKKAYGSHFWRYYSLAAVQMLVSAGVLWALSWLFNETRAVGLLTLLKMLVDTTLFFVSYNVQRRWVFVNKGE